MYPQYCDISKGNKKDIWNFSSSIMFPKFFLNQRYKFWITCSVTSCEIMVGVPKAHVQNG